MTRFLLLSAGILSAIGGCATPRTDVPDVDAQAAQFGINYDELKRHAPTEDAAARMFLLLAVVMDGAGAESCSGDLGRFLEQVGDRRFAALVRKVPVEAGRTVLCLVSEERSCWDETAAASCGSHYPETAALLADPPYSAAR